MYIWFIDLRSLTQPRIRGFYRILSGQIVYKRKGLWFFLPGHSWTSLALPQGSRECVLSPWGPCTAEQFEAKQEIPSLLESHSQRRHTLCWNGTKGAETLPKTWNPNVQVYVAHSMSLVVSTLTTCLQAEGTPGRADAGLVTSRPKPPTSLGKAGPPEPGPISYRALWERDAVHLPAPWGPCSQPKP